MSADKIPPTPGKDTIYLEADDEITAIIDKVEGAKQKVVALVLPKRMPTLQSIVNMRLLARSAGNAGKNVVLITGDASLMPLAGAAGLHVAKNLQSKPEVPEGPSASDRPTSVKEVPITNVDEPEEGLPGKISYDASIGALAEAHDLDHPETIELGDEEEVEAAADSTEKLSKAPKTPKDRAVKVPNFDRFRLWLGLGIVGFVALIVFIILAVSVLPKATIAITTTSTPLSGNLSIKTSGSATSYQKNSGVIPGYSKTSDQTSTQQVTATGQQNNGKKATGAVTLVNCSSPAQPITVPAGTGVSSGGYTFITQSTVQMPLSGESGGSCTPINGSSSGTTNVVAQTGGSKNDLPANSTFKVAGYPSVSGSNDNAFSGGTDSIVTVVSQSDVDAVKDKLLSAQGNSFAQTFENQLANQDYYVFVTTLNQGTPSVTANPAVGQPATNTSVTVKVTYTVLAVKKADLKQAIVDALSDQIDKSKQKLDESTLIADADISIANQSSPTNATLSIAENTSAIPLLDEASIKNLAKGKKTGVVTDSISAIAGVKSVKVKLSPFWVSKVPGKTSKITVTITHVNGG